MNQNNTPLRGLVHGIAKSVSQTCNPGRRLAALKPWQVVEKHHNQSGHFYATPYMKTLWNRSKHIQRKEKAVAARDMLSAAVRNRSWLQLDGRTAFPAVTHQKIPFEDWPAWPLTM
jgi:hypothetical protein